MHYQRWNNILGWWLFAVATVVYALTMEPTTSLWDCGEYIATAYKLMVGHPPGAPFFQMMGRVFSLFAGGDKTLVAPAINFMSVLSSGLTILFMFWTLTLLLKKLLKKTAEQMSGSQMVAVFGSATVGALTYTFSDSFWFSAVEGEVYAMSSFFTAITFWAILKWEAVAHQKGADRWLVFIAYLIGLSIGVHLLNLLAIPAMVYVYFFKRYRFSKKGFILTGLIAIALLALVQHFIIPQVVNSFAIIELFFVNSLGFPFNSGTVFFAVLLIAGLTYGIWFTYKRKHYAWNTVFLALSFILIGYSSFMMLVIRSNANTPLDQNNPDNAINLLAYLNREQYGDWPLVYGHSYVAPLDTRKPYLDGKPVYAKDEKAGKYVISDDRENTVPNYRKEYKMLFPRMWSPQPHHVKEYEYWAGITTKYGRGRGQRVSQPSVGNHMAYLFNYQLGWMYMRYFMWNFAGRQNDIQGHGNPLHGNWISGIGFIDDLRLGDQDLLPEDLKNNKARNRFYFLPLLLGLFGMVYHLLKRKRDFWVLLLLFFFTGIAIVLYLNFYPQQPRERDYAFAASFYAFALWIGIGAFALMDLLGKYIKKGAALRNLGIGLACLVLVPGIMAKEGWDDHDRSGRYSALAVAKNYLNSCAPNAILFTNGDNDTFPLWYAQEVEGIRTDVRVCNLNLLNMEWYIEQMKHQAYDSKPLPISLEKQHYRQGSRDRVYVMTDSLLVDVRRYYPLKDLMEFVKSENKKTMLTSAQGDFHYLPTAKISLPVKMDSLLNDGGLSLKDVPFVSSTLLWELNHKQLYKNHLVVLDILANNHWERPVYFAITMSSDNYLGLEKWFRAEGMAYRLVPVMDSLKHSRIGRVDTELLYDRLMTDFEFGNIQDTEVYKDESNRRMVMNYRNLYFRLADALLKEGKQKQALNVLDRCVDNFPHKAIPFGYFMLPIAKAYYQVGATQKANTILEVITDIYCDYVMCYHSVKGKRAQLVYEEKMRSLSLLKDIFELARREQNEVVVNRIVNLFQNIKK